MSFETLLYPGMSRVAKAAYTVGERVEHKRKQSRNMFKRQIGLVQVDQIRHMGQKRHITGIKGKGSTLSQGITETEISVEL